MLLYIDNAAREGVQCRFHCNCTFCPSGSLSWRVLSVTRICSLYSQGCSKWQLEGHEIQRKAQHHLSRTSRLETFVSSKSFQYRVVVVQHTTKLQIQFIIGRDATFSIYTASRRLLYILSIHSYSYRVVNKWLLSSLSRFKHLLQQKKNYLLCRGRRRRRRIAATAIVLLCVTLTTPAFSGGYTQNGDNNNAKFGMNGAPGGYHGGNNYNNSASSSSSNNNGSWANQFSRNDGYPQQPRQPTNNHRDYDLKGAEQGIQGLSVNSSSSHNGQQDSSSSSRKKSDGGGGGSSKKMTWATVASQPAKPQVTTTSLLVKKKGKGMPPPPMVPGKHNLDISSWDTPVREPTPPPSPPTPPPVEPTPIPINAQHQQAIEREEHELKQQQQR